MSKNSKNKAEAVDYTREEVSLRTESTTKGESKKFKYKFVHNIVGKLKTYIERLKETRESDLSEYNNRTLYQVFLDWLLETIQYGFIISVFVNVFVRWLGWHNLYMLLVFGLLRWFVLDVLSDIRQSLK